MYLNLIMGKILGGTMIKPLFMLLKHSQDCLYFVSIKDRCKKMVHMQFYFNKHDKLPMKFHLW